VTWGGKKPDGRKNDRDKGELGRTKKEGCGGKSGWPGVLNVLAST